MVVPDNSTVPLRHYEMVVLMHPEFTDQFSTLIQRYKDLIMHHQGAIHREEHWGLRKLEYPIKKIRKAYYVLINMALTQSGLEELKHDLAYNEAILRYLIIRCDRAITEPSPMLKVKEKTPHSTVKSAFIYSAPASVFSAEEKPSPPLIEKTIQE